jgi:hypothetical protein
MLPEDGLQRAVGRYALPERPSSPQAARLAEALRQVAGDSIQGIVFFGSHRSGASPGSFSAHDLFVVTTDYLSFYHALRRAGRLRRGPRLMAALNAWMPPNQLAFREEHEAGVLLAKCAVISGSSLRRETSGRRRDHFCCGRLFQPTEILHAADGAARECLLSDLVSALRETYGWVRPWLGARFDVGDYCRTALQVSMAGEVRPEQGGRCEALWEAERPELEPAVSELLAQLAAAGELAAEADGVYTLRRRVGSLERARWRLYFARSKLRATLRWVKHTVTFDGWLDYILRKVERHGGGEMALGRWERRWPLLLLWPRLLRFLRDRRRKGGG